MDLIDTHCHLNFKSFKSDFVEVSKRSRDKGVKKIIIVGSDSRTSQDAFDVAQEINTCVIPGSDVIPAKLVLDSDRGTGIYGANSRRIFAHVAVGIHPVHTLLVIPSGFAGGTQTFPSESRDLPGFEKIEKLARDPLVVAIGESGLDFYHDKTRKTEKEQVELFKKHIELAIKINKPLIIHNREADEKVREIVDEFPDLKKAVLHCFSTDHYMASWAIERGFYLSFTGNITYGNKKIKKAIEHVPVERIMVETDAPYNIPEPLRSEGIKRCEPYMANEVIRKIALIKGLDVNELSKQIYQNSTDFFGL